MPNMSYCRYENTLSDLRDCYENLEESEGLSETEKESRERLIRLCVDIALEFGHEVGDAVDYVDDSELLRQQP